MKVAIASVDKTKDSQISERGGRAPYFLIFENSEKFEILKNPVESGGGGVGLYVAEMLAQKNVDVFVTGSIGGNMEGALAEKNIEFKSKSGKVEDAIKEYFE